VKNFSLKNMKIGRIHHGTSPGTSCTDCETQDDIVSSGKEETAGSGSDANGNLYKAVVTATELAQAVSGSSGSYSLQSNAISLGGGPYGGGGSLPSGGYSSGGGSYAAGGVVSGSGGSYSIGAFSVGPPIPAVSEMKLNRKTLTSDEINKIIERIVVTVKPGERVIVTADPGTSQENIDSLGGTLRAFGLDAIVMTNVNAETFESEPVVSEWDRLDMLARLGVIWQERPNLRFGQLLGLALGMDDQSMMYQIPDEDLTVRIEKAYVDKPKKKKKKP